MEQLSIKILVFYHKPALLFNNDIITPFHCGRRLGNIPKNSDRISSEEYEWLKTHCLGDDQGENISEKNPRYCELAGHYWAWKNYDKLGNPNYIGFMQYRRILVFSHGVYSNPRNFEPFLTSEECLKYLDVKYLELGKYDIYAPQPLPVCKFKVGNGRYVWSKNPPEICKVKEQHPRGIGNKQALECIKKSYPDYYETALDYFERTECFQWNMFIFRKEIFFEYAKFAFDVLSYVEKSVDYEYLCAADQRCVAYLGEFITGIFISQKIKEKFSIKYLPMIHVRNTDIPRVLLPAFSENSVVVCCAADNGNALICEAMIQSIIKNSSLSKNYDIVVLYDNLSDTKKDKINLLRENRSNISIRFYCVTRLVQRRSFQIPPEQAITSLFFLCIPDVFEKYEKVIYLEHDSIAQVDVAELYQTDVRGKCLAASRDITTSAGLNCRKEKLSYYTETLGIDNPYEEYVSNSVVLLNVRAIRKTGKTGTAMQMIEKHEYKRPAQDSLNMSFYGDIYFLDSSWNVCPQWATSQYLPVHDYWRWQEDKKRAKILSFRGTVSKPWNNPGVELAATWWKYARQTPVYEEILTINTIACIEKIQKKASDSLIDVESIRKSILQAIDQKREQINSHDFASQIITEIEKRLRELSGLAMVREVLQLPSYHRKLRNVRIRALLSWGKRRQLCIKRKEELESKISMIASFLKSK